MRRDAARNQELILRTAHEVFSELGTDVGMEVVAGRAGVGVGTVYRHFPNKELLLDHLVGTMYENLVAAAQGPSREETEQAWRNSSASSADL